MKPVKSLPKFKCDFCTYRSIKHVVAKHEGRCFKNPDRFCDYCQNKGYTDEYIGDSIYPDKMWYKQDCPYCSQMKLNLKDPPDENKVSF